MISMKELSQFIFSYIKSSGFDLETVRINIAKGSDLNNTLQYGSSRIGLISNKIWEEQNYYNQKTNSIIQYKHQDIIIALNLNDLLEDAELEENGFLYYNLSIFENPFLTFYDGSKMKELINITGNKYAENYGKHYLFTVDDKNDAILGVASINVNNMMTGALTNISKSMGNFNIERFPNL